MKFNLKKMADKQGETHIEQKLRNQDSVKEHNEITQKQLENNRVKEKNAVIESLLDEKRAGKSDTIIEKKLNDSKKGLHKHRNAEAYKGNLNKVEEQRLNTKTQESEKAELASSVNPKKKWWDDLKASNKKKTVVAQVEEDFSEEQRWKRLQDPSWSGADEEGVLEDVDFDIDTIDSPEEIAVEENVLINPDIRPVDSPIAKGLFVSFDISPNSKASKNELKDLAYDQTLQEGYNYLANTDDFSPESFKVQGDKVVARLIGDEYYPEGKEDIEIDDASTNLFSDIDLQETDIGGIFVGNLQVNPSVQEMVFDMETSEIKQQAIDFILEQYDDIRVEEDGIDLDQIATGTIKFVGEEAGKAPPLETEELSPVANNDFDIIVLSKKK